MRAIRLSSRSLATLREPLANVPASVRGGVEVASGVQRSTTSNGIDVVTVDRASPHSAAVVAFRAGSRYESAFTSGSAAHLARLMYFANASGKTNVTITRDLLMSTSNRFARSNREVLTYGAEFIRDKADSVLVQLGYIAQPLIRGWEVEDSAELVEEDAAEDDGSFAVDTAHWVAFRGQGLGKAPVPFHLSTSEESLREYRDQLLTRANAVVVGVGVDHASFVKSAEKALAGLPAGQKASSPATRYIGGESHTEGSDHPVIVLALETGPIHSRDYLAAAVLQQVLGRTPDRFLSKPRPGHGMASRINQRLGGNGSVVYADSFVSAYSDAGLFGVVAQAISGEERVVAQLLAEELGSLARKPLGESELTGAKLRFNAVLAAAEGADTRASFFAQQALYSSTVHCRNTYVAQVDSLSAADIQAAAKKMLSSNLTFVTEGNSSNVTLADVKSKL